MNQWVLLDPHKFSSPPNDARGVDLQVSFSPYDIPSAIRGFWDEDKKRFCIEFKYMTDEPTHHEKRDDNVTLVLGKHSGRIYGIEVDIAKAGVDAVQLQCKVEKALKGMRGKTTGTNAIDRYQLNEDAIKQNEAALFSE